MLSHFASDMFSFLFLQDLEGSLGMVGGGGPHFPVTTLPPALVQYLIVSVRRVSISRFLNWLDFIRKNNIFKEYLYLDN